MLKYLGNLDEQIMQRVLKIMENHDGRIYTVIEKNVCEVSIYRRDSKSDMIIEYNINISKDKIKIYEKSRDFINGYSEVKENLENPED
jgi:hypothetical protein